MKKIRVMNEGNTDRIYLDYFHGTSILVSNQTISFDCNGQVKDVILCGISRDVFDNMDESTISYYEGKMAQKRVKNKEISFVKQILKHYLEMKKN